MCKLSRALTASGLALLVLSGPAAAQYYPGASQYRPGNRPQLSPYLNLLRDQGRNNGAFNGANLAIDYYLGTIPEQQRRANTARFGSELRQLEQATRQRPTETGDLDAELFRPLPTTGHPTGFNTTAGYFPQFEAGHRGQSRNLPTPPNRRGTTGR